MIINSIEAYTNSSFSVPTYQHAVLYVPAGQRWDVIYGGNGWFQFNNIREIVMDSRELTSDKAYMLMNTKTCNYTVYDVVNSRLTRVKSLYDMEEDNPANSWQIVKRNDKNYLYNIGARKYAFISANGEFALSSDPVHINIQENENGIIIGGNLEQSWAFVLNEKVQADANVTGIAGLGIDNGEIKEYFNVDGQHLTKPQKGVNIIRTSDGKTKKVILASRP